MANLTFHTNKTTVCLVTRNKITIMERLIMKHSIKLSLICAKLQSKNQNYDNNFMVFLLFPLVSNKINFFRLILHHMQKTVPDML